MNSLNSTEIWKPQDGPQSILVRCHASEDILYGGARGGGKTDGALGDWLYHFNQYRQYARGFFVRPSMPELEDAIRRAHELYRDIAEWREQKKTFHFFGGGHLRFRFLKNYADAQKYQGQENTWIEVEEAGNYPTPDIPDLLAATLRSAHGVTCRYLQTANPGGPGHNWIKARYIDPAPPFTPFDAKLTIGSESIKVKRIFIPAKLTDNRILMKNDPTYKDRIFRAVSGQQWLYDAWMNGSWDITAGGMFDDLWNRDIHVLKPFKIPRSWQIYRAFDWGSSRPFSVGWWAIADDAPAIWPNGKVKHFAPGSHIRVGEWYGWTGTPNKGAGTFDKDIAKGIKKYEKERGWKVFSGPADSSIFTEENGKSIAGEYKPFGIYWKKADKSPGSRVAGWRKIRDMLSSAIKAPKEEPGLYVFNICTQFIRTVPVLPRDDKKLDDVNTDAEDHIGDETRYMLRYKSTTGKMTSLPGF